MKTALGLDPGQELHLQVRAGLIARGDSLHAWAIRKGRDPSNVRAALLGVWTGPAATKVIHQAAFDAGLMEEAA